MEINAIYNQAVSAVEELLGENRPHFNPVRLMVMGCSSSEIAGGTIGQIPTIAGVGTIITAFFMGPLIDFFNRKFAIPFLNR